MTVEECEDRLHLMGYTTRVHQGSLEARPLIAPTPIVLVLHGPIEPSMLDAMCQYAAKGLPHGVH